MRLTHPETILPPPTPHPRPSLWKNCLTQNQSLVPKTLGTTALEAGLGWRRDARYQKGIEQGTLKLLEACMEQCASTKVPPLPGLKLKGVPLW